MAIHFEKVRWKNLLSTGNAFTEVQLDSSPNTLIVGSNGAGKSTILDALCFGLFGKPFRKIKKDQLLNSINLRDGMVEIEFKAGGASYMVRRGIKPNIFEIYRDGVMLDQLAAARDQQEMLERNILRLNIKSFTQIVILGSASFLPFMQLSTSTRREVIEDLLDIRMFSTMSSLLKERVVNNKHELSSLDKELSSIEDMISVQKARDEYDEQIRADTIKKINENIEIIQKKVEAQEILSAEIDGEIARVSEDMPDITILREKMTKLRELEKSIDQKRSKAKRFVQFYIDNDTCSTCSQTISESFKNDKIESKKKSIDDLDQALAKLTDNIDLLGVTINDTNNKLKEIDKLHTQKTRVLQSITADQREIKTLLRQIGDLSKPQTKPDSNIVEDLSLRLRATNIKKIDGLKQKELLEIATVILRDSGIKSRIIKQYIPVINNLVNKYLAAMDFFVKFDLNESFEEKILSRHRDDFTYESFSEGEKMRIDLALLFTWRAIAKMKNSASTNLLILDEVFDASLDTNGCDEFLKLMQTLDNTNTFIISHKGDILQDKFKNILRFDKHKNFSRIVGAESE
jgi:DNA repair exonuclease SbcCD ATPase subunit